MPTKSAKSKIPDIPWGEDNDKLVWAFLTECEKDVNYKVLFGKKETTENTSGDSKMTVFKRIAQVILPELFTLDGTTVANRLKGQLERLTKTYRKHAARLRQTGGGLEDENYENSPDERLRYYIPGEGPNVSTPDDALNLWQQIENEFKFFPRLHRIFASRPNVTPIVVTTALGPQGRKTIWYQNPDDMPTDSGAPHPAIPSSAHPPSTPVYVFGADVTGANVPPPTPAYVFGANITGASAPPPSTPARVFGTDVTRVIINETPAPASSMPVPFAEQSSTLPVPNSSATRAPRSSAVSREAIDKARSYIEKVPPKRTLLDTLVELQEKNSKMWNDEVREKLLIQKRAHLLEEFKLGLLDKTEYHEKVAELEGGGRPAKRQNTRQFSPDWDDSVFNLND